MVQAISCCNAQSVVGYGPLDAPIMAIGIAPGRHEYEVSKRPLTGPSGQLFDAILATYNLDRNTQVFATNLICYWKDKPDRSEIQVCAHRLEQEIATVNPRIILLLGSIVCETILGMKLSKARGAVIPLNGRYYLTSNHPAAALHPDNKELQINAAYDLVRDFSKLPMILNGDYDNRASVRYTVVDSIQEAQHLLDTLPPTTIALDIETIYDKEADISHPFSDAITCIGIGYEPDHAYVLTHNALSPDLKWPTDVKWLYHNGQFDTQEIAQHLHTWLPISHDTMLQSYSCDERSERGLHKLKHLAREFVGSDFYEEDEHHLDGTSDGYARLYQYNANDVCYTYRLHNYLSEWQRREDTYTPYESLLLPASEMCARSQFRGIHVNQRNVDHIEATFGYEYVKLSRELQTLATSLGYPELNLRSPIQLKAMLHAQGFFVPNTTKYTLQDLADADNVFVQKLLRYRTLERLINVYLHMVLDQVKYDGRVHPHAFLIGTVTGRLVYKDPPMQTLPKPKTVKDLGMIRSIFSATNDDYILLEADYKTIEGWIGAFLSEDDTMWDDLSSDDWHDATTTGLFHKTKEECAEYEWEHLRDAGKHINYGAMYEEQAQGLTRRPPIGIGCDVITAQRYLTAWYQRYKGFDDWRKQIKRTAQDVGEIVTPFGRKRRFPIIVNDHQLRQAVNFPIQSTASDYTISAAIRLWPQLECLDTHLLFLEHDALYYEVNRQNFKEVTELIKHEMEKPPLPGLPSIKIEMDAGMNLAELKRIHI